MEKAKIIFNDLSELDVEVNGDCYIVDSKPTFPTDLTNITIKMEQEKHYDNAILVECASIDKRYWFTFNEKSQSEIKDEELDNTINDLIIAILEG